VLTSFTFVILTILTWVLGRGIGIKRRLISLELHRFIRLATASRLAIGSHISFAVDNQQGQRILLSR